MAPTRRSVLGALGAGVGLTTLGATTGAAADSDSDYWTVVALPDTQEYADAKPGGKPEVAKYAHDQTRWIANNLDSENIVFVTHEGDVIDGYQKPEENADKIEAQWEFMDDVMSRLDGKVPYSTVTGNHDWRTWWDRSSSIAGYKEYFGPSRYDQYDWFGGAGPTNGDENRDNLNTYQLFSAGGYDFLHLALEWEVPGSVDDPSTPLGWAQKVLDEHPDRATILTTHSYLRDDPTRREDEKIQEADGDGNHAETIWNDLVSQNPQVFMVLSGHWHDTKEGEAHQVSTNEDDLPVYEMLANYQFRTQGGYGLLRRIEFHPGGGDPDRIQVRTYSPGTGTVEDDENSEFSFDLDFDERFAVSSSSPDTPQVELQQGSEGYDGTVDTTLRESDPETSYGTESTATVDADDPNGSGDAVQALFRFDGLVGTDDGRLPPGANVEKATLSLETADGGDGAAVHRMLTGWTDDDTWESTDGGVRADGSQATSDAAAQTGSVSPGQTDVDVTTSVQAWANGKANNGWVLLPLGDDGWDIRTAESDSPPTLTVQYTAPETVTGDADGDGDVDSDDVNTAQRSISGEDIDIDENAADVDGDGDVDVGDAVSIRNLSGDGA